MDSDSSASDALLIGAVTVTLALAVGFGLFKLFLPKEAATSPISVGRKWFAWMIFISTLICLPKFFHKLDADAFVTWLICCVFFGGLAFLLGYLYGLFRFRKKSSSVDAPMATSSSPVSPPPEISTKLMNDQDTSCDDEPFYAQAMMEIQNGNTSPVQ